MPKGGITLKSVTVVKIGSLRDPDESKRGQVEVCDIPIPPLGPEDVRIKVAYCAICGSDPHLVENIFGWEIPFGLGHEVSGIVVELGPKATRKGLKVGDRVAGNFLHFCGTCYYCQNGQQQFCEHAGEGGNSGMCEYTVWHESQVYKMPDNISLKEACLLEPVSVAVRLMDKIEMKIGQRVLICGGGPIGLLATQAVHMMGATESDACGAHRRAGVRSGAQIRRGPRDRSRSPTDVKKGGDGTYRRPRLRRRHRLLRLDQRRFMDLPPITAFGGKLIYAAMYPNTYRDAPQPVQIPLRQ